MPIASYAKLARFSDACGAEIPRWMRKRLEGYADDAQAMLLDGTVEAENEEPPAK